MNSQKINEHYKTLAPDLISNGAYYDLHILENFVKKHYSPSSKPLAMAVGFSITNEAGIIKNFHKIAYGIPIEDSKVFGCTLVQSSDIKGIVKDYNYVMYGNDGDALDDFTWVRPFLIGNFEPDDYDFIYIRNPDILNAPRLDAWKGIILRANDHLKPEGLITVVVRESDSGKYHTLLDMLNRDAGMKPIVSEPAGIEYKNKHSMFEDFHHTVGVFRKSNNLND